MPRTLRWPPEIVGGRAVMTADPNTPGADRAEAVRQIVRLSILDASSANPWNQQQGLGVPDPTFTGQNPQQLTSLRADIVRRMQSLARRRVAKLADLTIRGDGAKLLVNLTYHDLENGGREALEVTL